MFSGGAISSYLTEQLGKVEVHWSKKGKEWPSKKLLNIHLNKCIDYTGGIPDDWEIIELTHNATPVAEWIDGDMLIKILRQYK